MAHTTGSRNPRGLATNKPISLRLMRDELDDAERISKELNVSKSRLARDAYLAGLPHVIASAATTPVSSSAAELSGGESKDSSAGLSTLAA